MSEDEVVNDEPIVRCVFETEWKIIVKHKITTQHKHSKGKKKKYIYMRQKENTKAKQERKTEGEKKIEG